MKEPRSYTMNARASAVADTRDRIVRATIELLFHQAYEDVTLAAIAKDAGVSHQTVLNHFESKEGVARAAAAVIGEETTARRAVETPGDAKEAVHVLVGEYERFGDANARWAATSDRLEGLASILDDARSGHQAWLEALFSDSLPTAAAERRRAIHALHVATDVYTWKLLRRDLGISRSETERTMTELVTAVLERTSSRHRPNTKKADR